MISLKNIIELRFLYIQFVYHLSIIIEIIVVLYSITVVDLCAYLIFLFFFYYYYKPAKNNNKNIPKS